MKTWITSGDPEYVPPGPDDTLFEKLCDSIHDGYECTLMKNHPGRHIAHIYTSAVIVEVWD